MAIPGADYCWNCLNYLEWQTIASMWDASDPLHNAVHDLAVQFAAAVSGIGYKSDRFYVLMNGLGFLEVTTGLPFPFDHYWDGMNTMWYELGAQYDAEGAADDDECEFWKFPGSQGGDWPTRWP